MSNYYPTENTHVVVLQLQAFQTLGMAVGELSTQNSYTLTLSVSIQLEVCLALFILGKYPSRESNTENNDTFQSYGFVVRGRFFNDTV